MLSVNEFDLRVLQGNAERLTAFVDGLIACEMAMANVPLSNLDTNLRQTIPDGGVDSRLRVALSDTPSGWLDKPCVLQYKALSDSTRFSDDDLIEEINKKFARECIENGSRYVLVLTHHLSQDKVAHYENVLLQQSQAINSNAPPPRTIGLPALAHWINAVPPMLFEFLGISGIARLDQQLNLVRGETKVYRQNPAWSSHSDSIRRHCDFSLGADEQILRVFGLPGVGKTRLVIESVAADSRNFYTALYVLPDQFTQQLSNAVELLNRYKLCKIVIIADECGLEGQFRAAQIAGHLKDRLRIIAIDNSEVPQGRAGYITLERVTDDHLQDILASNFSSVPPENRDHYASISGGYVRFAADLCRQHSRIVADGHFGGASFSIRRYLSYRLGDRLNALAALSLVLKVGYLGEEAEELRDLARFVRRDSDELASQALSMKDSPGFVVEAGRYLYVTPEIVATAAFEKAWETWFSGDIESKLGAFPSSLLHLLEARISRSGIQSAQEAASTFFTGWALDLEPNYLQDRSTLVRFVKLIEMEPATFLPVLLTKLKSSPTDILTSLGGVDQHGRRLIVHQMERALAFPDLYPLVTEVLFVLSLHESEGWGNNATGIFEQSFSITNSGSSLPFSERLDVLRGLISRYPTNGDYFANLLPQLLDFRRIRHVVEPYLGRRLAPPLWEPKTVGELTRYAAELVTYCLTDEVLLNLPREEVLAGVAVHSRQLLGLGLFNEVSAVLDAGVDNEDVVDKIDTGVKHFIEYDVKQHEALPRAIQKIVDKLKPKSDEGWFRKALRAKYWTITERGGNSELLPVITDFAERSILDGRLPNAVIESLGKAREPSGLVVFSEMLGKFDSDLSLLGEVLDISLDNSDFLFLSGYLRNTRSLPKDLARDVLSALDRRLNDEPGAVSRLIALARSSLNATEFLIKGIRDGRVPIWVIATFIYDSGVSGRELSAAFSAMSSQLAELDEGIDQETRAALDEIAGGIRYVLLSDKGAGRLVDELKQDIVSLIDWGAATRWAPDDFPEIAAQLADFAGAKWAVDRVTSFLMLNEYQLAEAAEEALATLASKHTLAILDSIHSKLKEERNLYFELHPRRKLFGAMSVPDVLGWVQQDKMGRNWVARHLPGPKDVEGDVTLPEITCELLELYADDEHFGNSVAAGIESLRVSWGSLSESSARRSALYERVASKYSGAVKEWARQEALSFRQQAERWRMREEEENSPHDL